MQDGDREKEFAACNKHGLIRSYRMEDDFTVSAKQVEELLRKLDAKIELLQELLNEE